MSSKRAKCQNGKMSSLNSDFHNMKLPEYASDSLPVLLKEDYSAIPNNYSKSLSTILNVFERFDIIYSGPLFLFPPQTTV